MAKQTEQVMISMVAASSAREHMRENFENVLTETLSNLREV